MIWMIHAIVTSWYISMRQLQSIVDEHVKTYHIPGYRDFRKNDSWIWNIEIKTPFTTKTLDIKTIITLRNLRNEFIIIEKKYKTNRK